MAIGSTLGQQIYPCLVPVIVPARVRATRRMVRPPARLLRDELDRLPTRAAFLALTFWLSSSTARHFRMFTSPDPEQAVTSCSSNPTHPDMHHRPRLLGIKKIKRVVDLNTASEVIDRASAFAEEQ